MLSPPYFRILTYVSWAFVAAWISLPGVSSAIERVSVAANGNEVAGYFFVTDVTPDGRYVVFAYSLDDLVPGDSNGKSDVFVLDRDDGSIELISVNSNEVQPTGVDGGSSNGTISNDGRYVAFESKSAELVLNDTNGLVDVFVRDRQTTNTARVSLSNGGMQITGNSRGSISGSGNFVVFQSDGDDAVTGDTNTEQDVFRRDLVNQDTIRVSISDVEMEAIYPFGGSFSPSISDDGNRIGFLSGAENLVADDDNGHQDMFVRDVADGTTTRVSLTSTGAQQENGGCNETAVISANGLTVAFASSADNLVPGDNNGLTDVFVREIGSTSLEIVSVATGSTTFITDGFTSFPTISPDGRYVGFWSRSTQLDPRHVNGAFHGYIHDRQSKRTETINISTTGQFADNASVFDSSSEAPIFASGGVYVFTSSSDELVPGDTDETNDVYQSAYIPAVSAAPAVNNSVLCASLKNKLKKLKKKAKRLKKSGKKAKAKKLKKKMKKIKKQLKALGC